MKIRNAKTKAAETNSRCLDNANNENAKKVVRACEKCWEANKGDCNKFLKAVAAELNVDDFKADQNADDIIEFLERAEKGWTVLTVGDHAAGHTHAAEGRFVVAGMKSTDMKQKHGHVCVVTSGELVRSGADMVDYPRGYWGTLGGMGKKCEGMNYSFPAPARIKGIRYYWKALPSRSADESLRRQYSLLKQQQTLWKK